ncbi:MAG: DUF1854 domain-containing protein [Planctomycetota bacterium]|nr:DUF1854 domain-containing protein [Planctomycetota bacterium]MDA1142064.1 DUF1854 domain-containing protein [Planctomycetota bacterium]
MTKTGIHYLLPYDTTIESGEYDLLKVTVSSPEPKDYVGVFAVRAFPVSHPEQFISLRHTDPEDHKEHEIGVIENLSAFPKKASRLVRESLDHHYYEASVTRILAIRMEYNLLFFEIETTQGPQSITIRWSYDRAQGYGEDGKVLLDVHDNRYVIPDVNALPKQDRELFERWIYW